MSVPNPPEAPAAQALVLLSAQVLPVWARQLASTRSQSETAVTDMLSAFAAIGPHLDLAGRQSRQITAALAQDQGGITELAQACEALLRPVMAGCTPQACQAIGRVLAMIHASVDALDALAKPFEHETQMVSQQVERMYKGFQYQDRLSQMLSALHVDIERLQLALSHPETVVSAEEWLTRLESTYVMNEQRQRHASADQPGPDPADDEETTFF